MKDCARCGLINPSEALRCECGFDLIHGDAATARQTLWGRGLRYVIGGILLILFGLAGGVALLPIHFSLFVHIGSHQVDIPMLVVGGVLLARGVRIIDRPR